MMNYKKVLVVLQNAYAKGELAKGYSYSIWKKEFLTSRAGVRLYSIFDTNINNVRVINTTPCLGTFSTCKLSPSITHVRNKLKHYSPNIVIACGIQAAKICTPLWDKDLFVIPHPCSRVLTNQLLEEVGRLLRWRMWYYSEPNRVSETLVSGDRTRLQFIQERNQFLVVTLPGHAK